MARATFVKAARGDILNPDGTVKIAKGQSYWWWKFRFGGKHTSLTQPKPSQLTQSDFLSRVYAVQEEIVELAADESLPDAVQGIIDTLTEIRDECEEKRENMPEGLQDSQTGELLQSRYDALDEAISELEGIDMEGFEPADEQQCPTCEGDGKVEDESGNEVDCKTCEGKGTVSKDKMGEDGTTPLIEDPVNDDGETATDYWQAKLDEVQAVEIGTGD